MRGIEGEQVLLRLIVSESARADNKPAFVRIIEMLREEGLAGASAVRGIAGFGHDRRVHTHMIEALTVGLPIVVEVVDTQARIDQVLPKLEAIMAGGVMMMERAHVIRYVNG